MAETMKFGPQWLRNLSDGSIANNATTSSVSPTPAFVPGKYKLAEHRYGREEMLALYVPNTKLPECMKSFPSIVSEKALQPMAFIAPTEEEQRLMSQSVNSTAVLRMMGRGSGPSQRGGRGGGDRGRGRGRGRGEGGFSGFHRQTSLEDDGYLRGGRHGRGDGWEEGEKGRFERGASGFGARTATFEEGPTSPRKDFSRSMSTDNWRELRAKNKEEEEDEGGDWRRAGPREKWTNRSNWRDHRDREYERGRFDEYNEGGYRDRSYHRTKSGSWDDQESDLPEWSTAEVDDMDNLGTFDSSGAFMSMKEAKEMQEQEGRKLSRSWSGNWDGGEKNRSGSTSSSSSCGEKETGAENLRKVKSREMEEDGDPSCDAPKTADERGGEGEIERKTNKDEADGSSHNDRGAGDGVSPSPSSTTASSTTATNSLTPSPAGGNNKHRPDHAVEEHPQTVQHSANNNQQHQKQKLESTQNMNSRGSSSNSPSTTTTTSSSNSNSQVPSAEPEQNGARGGGTPTTVSSNKQGVNRLSDSSSSVVSDSNNIEMHHHHRHQQQQQQQHQTNTPPPPRPPSHTQAPPARQASGATGHNGQPSMVEDDFGHLEKAAEDLVATWTAEEDAKSDSKAKVESGGVPLDHEDAKKWFYRDPQGDLQGPFKAAEMAEWFSAGYFTMNLLVKRGCDATFQPLGELIKRWGRVPFLPGPALPPLKDGGMGMNPPPAQPQVDVQQEQLKLLQQQMIMQQQLYLQQVQMSQMVATLQQQESFAKLSPQQQQQLAIQLMLKHHVLQQGQGPQGQAQPQQPQQQQSPASAAPQGPQPPPSQQSPPQPQPQPQSQPPQSLSPRSEAQVNFQRQMSQPVVSQAAPPGGASDAGIAGYHRSMSQQAPPQPQQHRDEPPLWASANPTPTSAGWTAPTSVWDIEPQKPQSLDEIQRLERLKIDQQQREEAERERRRQEEEMRKRQEDEERRRQEDEIRRRQEEERRKQLEMEIERQRIEQLERIRLQREAEENARREEDRRRREEEDRRRKEEERRQREAEERRRQIEEQRRKDQEELERKRQEEIRRRQEKAEELRRQQQETLRRLQEEQMANMQLPQTAQWASNSRNSPSNSAPSLAEIQELEAQRAAKEMEEKQRRIEQQRQQLAAIQQQQQQQSKTWAQQRQAMNTNTVPTSTSSTPSLLEIQQEQALQLEREKQRQQQQQQQKAQNLPLRTAAVWSGASNASHWAAEGAWGNLQNRQPAGFWDDAVGGACNKKTTAAASNNNSTNSFPSLSTSVVPQQAVASNKNKASKAKREEESVQRLFQQAMKPKDEFTQWCENALRGMQSSVDVPTFVAFLMDVESPYEVHDYVRSYLGESKEAIEFGKQFLERRSKYKNHLKQEQPEEIWGPALAINPNLKNEDRNALSGSSKNNKKKKRMQKVDSSILGFTVHADTERLNMGDIECSTEAATTLG